MDIIAKAFNPAKGNARAVCAEVHGWMTGIIAKGDDSEQAIAAFLEGAAKFDWFSYSERENLIQDLPTESPVLSFYRNPRTNNYGWNDICYKNINEVVGKYPSEPYALKSDMMGMSADLMTIRLELTCQSDFLRSKNFNFCEGRDFVILSTASFEREKDWDKFNEAFLETVKALCGDHPEENWDKAERVLRNALGQDEAYVIIADADELRERVSLNVPQGEATDIRLNIRWHKKGWALMNSEWDESTDETIQARTGSLEYDGFIGLCITEITDSQITFRHGTEKRILTPGETIRYFYNDSYEDHEGVEHRDINHSLSITWLAE